MVAIEREINDLMGRLDARRFPRALGLEDQGCFAIGYHHQKAEHARRIAARKKEAAEAVEDDADA